jgi:prepilin-type N-terminal cleavage/methylation domain-containing protein
MTKENYNLRLLTFLKEKEAVTNEWKKLQNQNGVSLVEMMAVISIIVIISALALMNIGSSKQQLKRQNVAQELKVAFERARFDSVKRRAEVISGGADYRARVTVDAASFTLLTDVNQDGDLDDAGDTRTTSFADQEIRIASNSTLPYTVYFNKRGETTNSLSGSISPSFLVCNPSCSISGTNSNATASNANLVLVTPTGTVNLLPGGSAIPSFAAPSNISTVPNTNAIKNNVIINGN